MREVLFVAGEASGDMHAGAVAEQLARLRPDLRSVGVGGEHLSAAGAELLHDYADLAVMGFAEVLRHIPKHAGLLRKLQRRLASGSVAAIVLVDYPGFNMKLARAARDLGVPVVYYVTPQVWAWGAGRIPKLAQLVDRAAVILPFEENLLREHGVNAQFVGHPLLDRTESLPSREQARQSLGISNEREVVALFPGSRAQEIARHLADFVATGEELVRRRRGLEVLVHAAPTVRLDAGAIPFRVVRGASFALLRAADAAMCKSGTTTLEAAIAECPMIVAYRTGRLSYIVARRVVRIPRIGLVNVVADREVAREFVQDALEPGAAADELERLLDDPAYREGQRRMLREVRQRLGTAGAAARVARIVSDLAR